MKKLFVLLLAAVLVSATFVAPLSASAANVPEDARFEVFDLTAADADVDWYQDGIVVAIPNDGDEELTVASGDYQLRYVFILLFDKDGVCVEVGNNLLSADDERAAEFPQHDVKIPAKGFGVFFYYNANEGPANLALYEYYEALGGTMYSNETGRASKSYVAVLENNTVTVYFAAADAPAESAPSEAPEESSEAPAASETPDESSEAPAASETPSAGTSSAETPDPSSEAPAASNATSSQAEESSAGIGSIVGIIIAVVAVVVVAAVVIVLVVRKKKG